jgi:hypothetical protein
MKGRVVLENNTGHALHAIGCGFFAVALQNAHYRPQIAWASCAHRYTFPVGESSYPVTVESSYLGCTSAASADDEPACIVDGDGHPAPPPLAPGTYQATLFQITRLVPTPPSITVHVTNMTPG